MAMILSKASEYGIRAILYLATQQVDGYLSIRTIADELDLSFHFLTKIFQKLTQAGLLESLRGPNGGVALARPAAHITLREVYVAIEGPELFESCVLGLPGCGEAKPCPLHDQWVVERTRLDRLFATTTLAELAADYDQFEQRLTAAP